MYMSAYTEIAIYQTNCMNLMYEFLPALKPE